MTEFEIALVMMGMIFVMMIAVIIFVYWILQENNNRKKNCTELVYARIADFKSVPARRGHGYIYTPIYEYEYQGTIHRGISSIGKDRNTDRLGESEYIYINPYQPEEIYLESETGDNRKIIFLMVGIVLAFATVAMIKFRTYL